MYRESFYARGAGPGPVGPEPPGQLAAGLFSLHKCLHTPRAQPAPQRAPSPRNIHAAAAASPRPVSRYYPTRTRTFTRRPRTPPTATRKRRTRTDPVAHRARYQQRRGPGDRPAARRPRLKTRRSTRRLDAKRDSPALDSRPRRRAPPARRGAARRGPAGRRRRRPAGNTERRGAFEMHVLCAQRGHTLSAEYSRGSRGVAATQRGRRACS